MNKLANYAVLTLFNPLFWLGLVLLFSPVLFPLGALICLGMLLQAKGAE